MNPYKIYKHPSGDIEAVKQGWSWPGFFFNFIWVMIKQLWKILGIMILALVMFSVFICVFGLGEAKEVLTDAFCIALNVTCGAFGNFWREDKLISRSYKLVHIVTASSAEDAIEFHINSVS